MTDKPFSPACERNRDPILAVLRRHFADRRQVLEIGSGSGQHAVHFAAAMPWLLWQCSDVADNLPGIALWLEEARLSNTPAAIELDVGNQWPAIATSRWRHAATTPTTARRLQDGLQPPVTPDLPLWERWKSRYAAPAAVFDAIFSANTLHIMAWPQVEAMFDGIATVLADDATVVVYGPFNYGGDYTSASNRDFDGWLKARDPHSGIRDFEAVDALARRIGLHLIDDVAMPANNRCLVWRRVSVPKR